MTYTQQETTDVFTGKKSMEDVYTCDNPECKKRIYPENKNKEGLHFCNAECFVESETIKGTQGLPKLLYRYYAIFVGEYIDSIHWQSYKVISETEHHYRILVNGTLNRKRVKTKLVRKKTACRFAWPTRKEAMDHFWIRTRFSFLKAQQMVNVCNATARRNDEWHHNVTRNSTCQLLIPTKPQQVILP